MKFWCDYSSRFRILKGGKISLVVSALISSATLSFASPSDGVVTSGSANISQSGKTTNINQSTNKASINWKSFNISKDEIVNFVQPDKNSITLNRVTGTSNSIISGMMNATGSVILVNPNGVVFTKDATVNVEGLIATTKNITDENFNNNKYIFEGDSQNSILNYGNINAKYVAMMAKEVTNDGKIVAKLGRVELAGGERFTLDINGNSLLKLTIDKGTLDALVENKGIIVAEGGIVHLTTNAIDDILDSLVNNSGMIEAQTASTNEKGEIVLFANGGTANVGGTLDASATTGDGGFIETSGKNVNLQDDLTISTKSTSGNTGTWLIDPNDFTVASSGGDMTGALLSSNLGNNNVQISTSTQGTSGGNGDIIINDDITWSSGNTLTLIAERNININATLDAVTMMGGKVALEYGQGSVANGNSATYTLGSGAKINLQAGANFSTKLGSDGSSVDYTVITSLGAYTDASSGTNQTLQGMARSDNLSGNFVLGGDIDASSTSTWNSNKGFKPIGSYSTSTLTNNFSGNFDGLGHTISGLTINLQYSDSASGIGLFGSIYKANISNLNLSNFSIQGVNKSTMASLSGYSMMSSIRNVDVSGANIHSSLSTNNYGGSNIAGLVANALDTDIYDSSVTSSTLLATYGSNVGGLVATMNYSTVSNSYSSANDILATRNSTNYGTTVGGLIGSMSNSTVTSSYSINNTRIKAENNVAGGLIGSVGAGVTSSTITNSYASGNTNIASSSYAGGLIGTVANNAIVSDSYALTNTITAGSNFGGLFGYIDTSKVPNITNSFYKLSDTTINSATNVITYGGLFDTEYTTWTNASRVAFAPSTNSASPFIINNEADFKEALAYIYTPDVQLQLGGNLALSSGEFFPALYGTLDGNNYIISELDISQSNSHMGLVGFLVGGTIKDITLTTPTVHGSSSTGALVGESLGSVYDNDTSLYTTASKSTISNVLITGATVSGSSSVGGVVGYAKDTVLDTLDIHSTSSITGTSSIGGLVGYASDITSISNATSYGNTISASDFYAGGAVGNQAYSTLDTVSSYDNTISSTTRYAGGLVGMIQKNSTVTDSYAQTNIISSAQDVGGLFGYIYTTNTAIGDITNSFYKISDTTINSTLNVLTFGGLFDTEYTTWTNASRVAFAPSTNSASPFMITDETTFKEALAYSYTEGVQLKLGSDITLSAGIYMPALYGTLDGNNYTINSLSIDQAYNAHISFLGYLVGGTLKNITVDTPTLTGYGYVGGLVSEMTASSYDMSLNDGNGGFVSTSGSTIQDSSVTNFTNNWASTRTLKLYTNVGGAVGYANDYSTIDTVSASGAFSIASSQTGYQNDRSISNIGGLIGASGDGVSISNSSSSIDISLSSSVEDKATVSFNSIGGVIGTFGKNSFYTNTMTNTVSTGDISLDITPYTSSLTSDNSSQVTFYYVGGIAGRSFGATFNDIAVSNDITVTSSDISDTNNRTTIYSKYIGGLVGYSVLSNYGTTTAVSSGGAIGITTGTGFYDNSSYIGGLVGQSDTDTYTKATSSETITINATNTNKLHDIISSYYGSSTIGYIGGLIGKSQYSVLKGANSGDISASGNISITQTLTNSASSSTYPIGGLIGYSKGDLLTKVTSANTLTIAIPSVKKVGGLIGEVYYSTINNSSTSSNIDLSSSVVTSVESIGGFIGKSTTGVSELYAIPYVDEYIYPANETDYTTQYTSAKNAFLARSDVQGYLEDGYMLYDSSYYSDPIKGYSSGITFDVIKPNFVFGDYNYISSSGTITIRNNATKVGGLIGESSTGLFTNVSSYVHIDISNSTLANYIGGLVGSSSYDDIVNSTSSTVMDITSPSISNVGGLLGSATGEYKDDTYRLSMYSVSRTLLDGESYETIHSDALSDYNARADVIALVADGYEVVDYSENYTEAMYPYYELYFGLEKSDVQFGSIKNSTITSSGEINISGATQRYIGGITGNSTSMLYDTVTVAKNITITDGTSIENVGGLIGSSTTDNIKDTSSSQTISITSTEVTNFGGLVGTMVSSTIDSSSSSVAINGTNITNGTNIGGLVGQNTTDGTYDSVISDSTATGTVNVLNGTSVGGLVGYNLSNTSIAKITGLHVGNSVTGNSNVGGLVGDNSGLIELSYSTGSVTGTSNVGGLVGINEDTIQTSYSTGSVNGETNVGGLVGENSGDILNTYTLSSVTGTSSVGGLIGSGESGELTNSYASNTATGTSEVNGLIGSDMGMTVNDSYFNTTVNTTATDTQYGATGDELSDITSDIFDNWDMGSSTDTFTNTLANLSMGGDHIWLLPPPPTQVSYLLSSIITGYTYSGNAVSLSTVWGSASDIFGSTYSSWVYGTDYKFKYNGNYITDFTNASTYSNITIDILKTGFVSASSGNTVGSLVIAPKTLNISGFAVNNKTYDGSNVATVSNWGSVSTGIGTQTLVLNHPANATFSSVNAGDGITVLASGYTLSDGTNGGLASNYILSSSATAITTANITKKILSISGFVASNKAYDGTLVANISNWGTVDTGIEGETLVLNNPTSATFSSKNVSNSAITVTADGYTLANGTGALASNYELASTSATTTASITPKIISITGFDVDDKGQDGTDTATVSNWGSVSTGVGTETLVLNHPESAIFASTDIAKDVTVTASGYTIGDGENGGLASNYALASTDATTLANIKQGAQYSIDNENVVYGSSLGSITPAFFSIIDGSRTGSATIDGTYGVLVLNINGDDVTTQALNGTLNAGTYTIKATLTDENFALTSTGHNDGILTIGKKDLSYTLDDSTITYGRAFTPTTPKYSGTSTGTTSVKVYDSTNKDVTQEALNGTLAVGTYTLKGILTDDNYKFADLEEAYGTLTINSAFDPSKIVTNIVNGAITKPINIQTITTPSVGAVDKSIASKKVASSIVPTNTTTAQQTTASTTQLGGQASDINQLIRSVSVVEGVDTNTRLTLVSQTGGEAEITSVSMDTLMQQNGGVGELRVALSPDSFVELVNGGVKLPDNVSQEFYVVKE